MKISRMEELEYQEGTKVCMHYENLRRQGLTFFWTAQSVFAYILFKGNGQSNSILEIILPIIGFIISWATLNNDFRVIDYYWVYMNRIKKIEKKYYMDLYSRGRNQVDKKILSLPNSVFFRSIPIIVGLSWLTYLIINIILKNT